jgi:yeast amino acid transporter
MGPDERLDKQPSPLGSPTDVEKQGSQSVGGELQRTMSSRHLLFIAIGGAVGTGLFLSSGSALSKAGPVGSLIAYVFVGTMVYSVMTSLGEMATFIPITGSFTSFASRFVDRSLGFSMGWLYWFSCGYVIATLLHVQGSLWLTENVLQGLLLGRSN